jgi:hypothetical protein
VKWHPGHAAADTVGDAKDSLEEVAAQVYGEKTTVDIKIQQPEPAAARRAEDKPSALRDDPVLSAFRKHLGGELVKENK